MKSTYKDSLNLLDMSVNELEELSKSIIEILNQKRMQKKDEDWKKVVDTMQTFIKNWGAIIIDCEHDDNILLDEDITFPYSGTIHPAFFY